MALIERKEIFSRTVLLDGSIAVREDTVILRDGVEISRLPHVHMVSPGDDLALESGAVRRLGAVEHTPAVIRAFEEAQLVRRGAL